MNIFTTLGVLIICSSTVVGIGVPEYILNKKLEKQYSEKQYEAAIETLMDLVEKYPEKGEYNHNIGQLYLEQNKPQEAEMYFGKALQKLPESKQEDTLSNLAASYLLQQNLNVAKELYKKILKNNPNNQIAKHNLELILNLEKEEQENQEQEQESQEQEQESQEQDQEQDQENKNNEPEAEQEKDNQEDGSNQEEDKDDELERELEEARQAQQEEEERRKQMAYDILNQLSQREQEAREKHAKKDVKQQAVDYDW